MRNTGSPYVSPVTCVDDEGDGPPEFMCHMWMPERPPHIAIIVTGAVGIAAGFIIIGKTSSEGGN